MAPRVSLLLSLSMGRKGFQLMPRSRKKKTLAAHALTFALGAFFVYDYGLAEQARSQSFDYIVDRSVSFESVESLELPYQPSIAISSNGGNPVLFRRLSEVFRGQHARLHFIGNCFSACAEYIFTTKTERVFYPTTLIGFHWNDAINHAVTHELASERCRAKYLRATELRAHHLQMNNVEPRFWTEVLDVLKLMHVSVHDEETCSYAVNFENELWIPDANQLYRLTGIEVPTDICNERLSCIEARYRRRDGQRIVIGLRPYMAERDALKPLPSD